MTNKPVLSIVTPTTGRFASLWLSRLLEVKGNIEFILVFPFDATIPAIDDSRVTCLKSLFKGEVMQRATGLLNARGDYILALDDDDFIHPEIVALVREYFMKFPKSMFLRLRKEIIDYRDTVRIEREWGSIPSVEGTLSEVPIAPLNTMFDPRLLFGPFIWRRDHEGAHMENFNSGIWRAELARQGITEYLDSMKIGGSLKWITFWGLDRPLSLYIQAKYFKNNAVAGHWMPGPPQLRYVAVDPAAKMPRFCVSSELLLLKSFPQSGYVWNLAVSDLWSIPRTWLGIMKRRLFRVKIVK